MEFADHDPDAAALLLVQQYLEEHGYTPGECHEHGTLLLCSVGPTVSMLISRMPLLTSKESCVCDTCAALRELEKQCGLRFVAEKLPRGSMLLEVRMPASPADAVMP